MPSCRAPNRPLPLGPRRTGRNDALIEKWAQPLAPYMEPLPRRRITSTPTTRGLGNAGGPNRRSRSATAATHTNTNSNTNTNTTAAASRQELGQGCAGKEGPSVHGNSIAQLSGEEQSICDLMVGLLQYKSAEEARHILAEVNQLAQSRRLLALYSGVYGNNGDAGEPNMLDRIRERARLQLIRQLQQQLQEEEEEREKDKSQRERDLNSEEEKHRRRWRKLFGRDNTSGNKTHSSPPKKKRGHHIRKSARGTKAAQKEKISQQQQQNSQQEPKQYESKTWEEIASARITSAAAAAAATSESTSPTTATPTTNINNTTNTNTNTNTNTTNTFGVVPNVPRRVKRAHRVASFDESCANRYAAETVSGESALSPTAAHQANVNTPDDSVRQSISISVLSRGGDTDTDVGDQHVFNERGKDMHNTNDAQREENDTMGVPLDLTSTARPVSEGIQMNSYPIVSIPQPPPPASTAEEEKQQQRLSPDPEEIEDEVIDEVTSVSNSSDVSKSENKDREKELNERREKEGVKPSLTTENGNVPLSNPTWELDDDKLPWEI
ncbi:uncharacterized protein TM35_000241840 [Trypanosoma theileri]|uniref:Uncharacterized protein n=1 Tax=Trypanosoma theileri TaxID=67003 RepID=A0A1X0NQR1_9TRYP|nr:uncharacterized protein TM35_000241840 [Trypanosoma theileri]ORC87034.1 hypothetical protein TM35_000241840 [Trypanosoma theileri]